MGDKQVKSTVDRGKLKECPVCGGTGQLMAKNSNGQRYKVRCPACGGRGYV